MWAGYRDNMRVDRDRACIRFSRREFPGAIVVVVIGGIGDRVARIACSDGSGIKDTIAGLVEVRVEKLPSRQLEYRGRGCGIYWRRGAEYSEQEKYFCWQENYAR